MDNNMIGVTIGAVLLGFGVAGLAYFGAKTIDKYFN